MGSINKGIHLAALMAATLLSPARPTTFNLGINVAGGSLNYRLTGSLAARGKGRNKSPRLHSGVAAVLRAKTKRRNVARHKHHMKRAA